MKLVRRRTAQALALALGLVGTAAFGPAAVAQEKPKVALVMKSLANEFFRTMEDGAKAHQKAHASEYTLLSNGIKDETDTAAQIKMVEQMAAQRINALVIAPADSKALVPVIKTAVDRGIVVINIDNQLDAAALKEKNLKVPFVGPDNRAGAKLVGDYLAKQLQAGAKVEAADAALLTDLEARVARIEAKLWPAASATPPANASTVATWPGTIYPGQTYREADGTIVRNATSVPLTGT